MGRTGVTHGFHCGDVIEIPTGLNCSVCPLYAVKRKDRRHALACPEGRKGRICPILSERQVTWVAELVGELREGMGMEPTATDRIRIEQIVRHRSRLFQIGNYLQVVGLLDLKLGEMRDVGERMTSVENALSRSLSEFRMALAERRVEKANVPTVTEYVEAKGREEKGPEGGDGAND
jgi:hypothetical protein